MSFVAAFLGKVYMRVGGHIILVLSEEIARVGAYDSLCRVF